eukprot:3891492-Pleurochrysis_carterae.AAC.1
MCLSCIHGRGPSTSRGAPTASVADSEPDAKIGTPFSASESSGLEWCGEVHNCQGDLKRSAAPSMKLLRPPPANTP